MSSKSQLDTLTPREREILVLIAEGASLPEIAQKLHRSLKTIESHRLSLGKKLKVSNRVELAKIAIAEGLISVHGDSSPAEQTSDQELELIKQINDTLYNATGLRFLQRFCKAASLLPGVEVAALCTSKISFNGGTTRLDRVAIASSIRGIESEPTTFNAAGTPCEDLIEKGTLAVTQGITDAYPGDPWLKEHNAESYFGITLRNESDKQIGGIGLIGTTPMTNLETLRNVMSFFTPRVAGVLQTWLEIQALRQESIESQSNSSPATVVSALNTGMSPDSAALAQTLKKVQSLTGVRFLRGVVDALCDTFGTQYAGICEAVECEDGEQEPSKLKSVIFRAGDHQSDPIAYNTNGTPCKDTIREGVVCIPKNASKVFPEDEFFETKEIESYVGIRLTDSTGKTSGVAWLVDARPLEDASAVKTVLSYLAPRIGAELEELSRYEQLLQEREELESSLAALQAADEQTA